MARYGLTGRPKDAVNEDTAVLVPSVSGVIPEPQARVHKTKHIQVCVNPNCGEGFVVTANNINQLYCNRKCYGEHQSIKHAEDRALGIVPKRGHNRYVPFKGKKR